jgi:hypothetical protein
MPLFEVDIAQEHKSQGHEINHALKKTLPKATPLPKNSY